MATETAAGQDIRKRFEQEGFVVTSGPSGEIEVRKSGCAAFVHSRQGEWIYSGPPYFVVHNILCELEDQGYQKFWFSKADIKRFPIRKVELEVLHRFDEEVRHTLKLTSLYNESLGTTNARTVYDRLEGRPDR